MKKAFLSLVLLLCLAGLGGSGYYLFERWKAAGGQEASGLPKPNPATQASPTKPTGQALSVSSEKPGKENNYRNIGFSYQNSKAKKVQIRADFTGWKPELMNKDKRSVWSYTAKLLPGEYAYCFMVDGKIIRDPANKKRKQYGQTQVSAITVKPKKP